MSVCFSPKSTSEPSMLDSSLSRNKISPYSSYGDGDFEGKPKPTVGRAMGAVLQASFPKKENPPETRHGSCKKGRSQME
jgi:hypothetical protein